MELSNKSLAFLLVVAIVISVGGTMISLTRLNSLQYTGFTLSNSPQGTANLTINSSLVLTFVVSNVDFGTGYTNDTGAGMEYCIIDTNGTNPSGDCVGFNSNVGPFELQNDGNRNLTVTLSANKNASDFITGTSPVFQFFVENNATAPGCASPQPSSWTNANTSTPTICPSKGFDYTDGSDVMDIHVKVSIPQDATPGSKTAIFTASGSDV